jgi:hypothetical protein
MDNTAPNPQETPPPRFEWFPPGVDAPRLAWSEFLRLIALQLEIDYPCPGPRSDPGDSLGAFLAAHLIALAEQASALQAWSPGSHIAHAQEAEAAVEAAWYQVLDQAGQPDGWEATDDVTGSLDGHPSQDEGGPIRGWFSCDSEDETYLN